MSKSEFLAVARAFQDRKSALLDQLWESIKPKCRGMCGYRGPTCEDCELLIYMAREWMGRWPDPADYGRFELPHPWLRSRR